jgi:hypothetical protein
MVLLVIIVVVVIVAFTLYTTDMLHKMKDDMRLLKIRSGKIVHLLDAVLTGSGDPEAAKLTARFRQRLAEAEGAGAADSLSRTALADAKKSPRTDDEDEDDDAASTTSATAGTQASPSDSIIASVLRMVRPQA